MPEKKHFQRWFVYNVSARPRRLYLGFSLVHVGWVKVPIVFDIPGTRGITPGSGYSFAPETQKRLKSGFKIISWTVSTLEGGGSIMLPALYTLSSLRFWLARNARAYTSARSIGFCVIWVCISSSSSSFAPVGHRLNVLVRRRAPAAFSIACPLSCCIGLIIDYVAG